MRLLDLVVYVNAHPALESGIIWTGMVATGLLSLMPLVQRCTFGFSILRQAWLFLLVIGISMFACRFPAFFSPGIIDRDEPQMLAQAITYESHPIPWRDVDGGSGGPLNSYALLWCVPFGIQPTFLSGRVFQTFCLWVILMFLYLAGRRVAGDFATRVSILPAFLFVSWTVAHDFDHYSSEGMSVLLLSLALYLITRLSLTPDKLRLIFLLGLALGLLPFAKIQSVLLGGFLGLTTIWIFFQRFRERRSLFISRALWLVIASAMPSAIILSVVAWAGAFPDFWNSYITANETYGSVALSFREKLETRIDLVAWLFDPGSDIAVILLLAGASTLVLALHLFFKIQKVTHTSRHWFVWAVLFALTSVITVLYSGRAYPHYEYFLLPAFSFLMAVNFRLLRVARTEIPAARCSIPFLLVSLMSSPVVTANWLFPGSRVFVEWTPRTPWMLLWLVLWIIGISVALTFGWLLVRRICLKVGILPSPLLTRYWPKVLPLVCVYAFFILPAQILSSRPNDVRGTVRANLNHPLSAMAQALLNEKRHGARIAIWGWAPEFAAETQTALGTRDAVAPCDATASPLSAYFRQRFLRDMLANRPELFLEATGPDNFAFGDAKRYGIETFPELAAIISKEYRPVTEIDGMRLFVRRDLPKMPASDTSHSP